MHNYINTLMAASTVGIDKRKSSCTLVGLYSVHTYGFAISKEGAALLLQCVLDNVYGQIERTTYINPGTPQFNWVFEKNGLRVSVRMSRYEVVAG